MPSKAHPHPEERPKGASRRARLEGRKTVMQPSSQFLPSLVAHSASTSPFDPPVLQSLPYPSACPRAWISKPVACRLRFITAASPPVGIQSAIDAPTKRRMRPIRRVLHETVFHRVEMRVVHVSRKVPIVAYRVLPIPPPP